MQHDTEFEILAMCSHQQLFSNNLQKMIKFALNFTQWSLVVINIFLFLET